MLLFSFIINNSSDDELNKCLSSFFSQSFNDFEVICTNNNQNQNKVSLNDFKRFKNFKIVDIKNNENIFEKTVKIASGKYVCFLNSDYVFSDNKSLENLSDYINNSDDCSFSVNNNLIIKQEDYLNNILYNQNNSIKKNDKINYNDYKYELSLSNFFFNRDLISKLFNFDYDNCDHESLLLINMLKQIKEINTYPISLGNRYIELDKTENAEKLINLFKNYRKLLLLYDNETELLKRISNEFLKIEELNLPKFNIKEYDLIKNEIEEIETILKDRKYSFSFKNIRLNRWIKNIIHGKVYDFDVAISVIIPTYNVEKYVGDCLNSLINQSFKNFEIIIVDDFSNDSTVEVINYYSKIDNRIRILTKNEKNGSGGTRNFAMKFALGKYVIFVDADDWIDLDSLEKLYSIAEKYETQNLMFKGIHYDENSKKFYKDDYFSIPSLDKFENSIFNIDDIYDELFEIFVGPVNKLYLRSFLEDIKAEFPENLIHQDNPFFYNVFCEAQRSFIINEYLYNRRVWTGSITTLRDDTELGTIEIVEYILKVFINNNLYENYKELLLNRLIFKLRNRYKLVGDSFKEEYFKRTKRKIWKFIDEYNLFDDFADNLWHENRIFFDKILYSEDYNSFLESSNH